MKKLAAVALAGSIAAASVGLSASTAEANGVGSFLTGALVGGAVVALAHGWHPFSHTYAYAPVRTYSYYPAPINHVAWCRAHYRSYNSGTDTFVGYDGYSHACVSPH